MGESERVPMLGLRVPQQFLPIFSFQIGSEYIFIKKQIPCMDKANVTKAHKVPTT